MVVKKDKVPLDQWDKYLAFRRAIYDDEVRMTPFQNPEEASKWQGANDSAFAPQIFGRGAQIQLSDDQRQKLQAVLENLRKATAILEANPPADAGGVAKAAWSANWEPAITSASNTIIAM